MGALTGSLLAALWAGSPARCFLPPPDGQVPNAATSGGAAGTALVSGPGGSAGAVPWQPFVPGGHVGVAALGGAGPPVPEVTGGGLSAGRPPTSAYTMGSFTSCEKGLGAWRGWLVWYGDVRPFSFVAVGADPQIFDASTDDVAELRADLADAHPTAADFDRKHRARVARVWAVEVPSQADFVRAQLGVGTWANGAVALCGWGNLRKGRIHRFRNPWVLAELEAAIDRNGLRRPGDAPLGALARACEAEKAPPAGAPAPGVAGPLLATGAGGPCRLAAAGIGTSGCYDGIHGTAAPGGAGAVPRVVVPPCRHDSPVGVDALASCAGCQAHRLAALAAGVEPPWHLPGVLRCGHRMDSMDLCCSVCAEHVDGIEAAMGESGPALEIVGGIGGPLPPDPATYVRVDPVGYLRIATDELVRKLSREGGSAPPLSEAIQAAQMLDMFFPRDRVMGFAVVASPVSGGPGRPIARGTLMTRTLAGAISR